MSTVSAMQPSAASGWPGCCTAWVCRRSMRGRYPHEFSGGQRQRIGIARALACGPTVVIGDEPVSALDVSIQAQILNILAGLKADMGLTLVLIAHDLAVIRQMADRVAVMYLGEVVEEASADALFTRPAHPYTAALMAAIPIPAVGARPVSAGLDGEPPNPVDPPEGCRFPPALPVRRGALPCRAPRPAKHRRRTSRELPFRQRADACRDRCRSRPAHRTSRGAFHASGRCTITKPWQRRPPMTVRFAFPPLPCFALTTGGVAAQDLKIGLEEDPDVLDPDQSRSFVGRIVYASLCDKLVDITPELEIIPQLATDWSWSDDGTGLTMTLRDDVTFHDGTPFNADAVVRNIDRSQNLDESRRKSEVASIDGVEATGEHEVLITVSEPDATLIAQFADRAGHDGEPRRRRGGGCCEVRTEPGVFRALHVFRACRPGTNRTRAVRRLLEQRGTQLRQRDLLADPGHHRAFREICARVTSTCWSDWRRPISPLPRPTRGSTSPRRPHWATRASRSTWPTVPVQTLPGGEDARLRKALSLAIDREALNQVVFDGTFVPGNQPFPARFSLV